ncbi:MAG TPA: transketolase [Gemmatimonadales bacterium]|nr:transketolase [Gemmatimonadales bacterium]
MNSIRVLAMDAVEQANSGHPGTPMALAPVGYVLWSRFLRHNPTNPAWPDRDRFVLSCGHASMLSYALLHLSGYDLSLDDIKAFRQWGSKTPGHPERGHTAGIETTTGPLGQGVGNAVGMALAERLLGEHFNRPGHTIVDHRTWSLVSDGDLMEGVASEAASIAGHLGLGKLTLIYDDNGITIDGKASLSFSEDVARRFEAYGWRTLRVHDGNDLEAIDRALADAAAQSARPTLILLTTRIGDPAPTKGGTAGAHGAPLGADEVRRTKEILHWPEEPKFRVAPEALEWAPAARQKGGQLESEWSQRMDAYRAAQPELAQEWDRIQSGALPAGWESAIPVFSPADGQLATRQASARTLNALAPKLTNLVGGSADLAESTGAEIKGGGSVSATTTGRNLHWGIREHGMAATLNGMAAHGGIRPFGSTFLIFTDYCKPSIRLSALMQLPVIYIGTHDSIGLGEDGPTHQPIEQLAMLRATPNVHVLRPADATETAEAWRSAVLRSDGPTVLALSRQKLPVLDRVALAGAEGVRRGGYVLRDCAGTADVILIATGSEVHLALAAADKLTAAGRKVRVVSLPCWEQFDAQPESYRHQVLPPSVKARVSVEAAATMGWHRFVGDAGIALGLDHFGASAPAERLFREFGLTVEAVVAAAEKCVRGEK